MNNKKENLTFTCTDCAVSACDNKGKTPPPFCPGENMDPQMIKKSLDAYKKNPEDLRIALAAAEVEAENYCKMTRIEETIEFAKKIGAEKIGIAACVGLTTESITAAKIIKSHGLEVCGIRCKAGTQRKSAIGIPKACESVGTSMCNPILQARYLNEEHTDLNILIGLCVGHDSLFYKYSEAPVTTLIAKDRVLGHNPAAALYQADSYYKKLFGK